MKTRFFTFLVFTVALGLSTQAQIPNPGFENWTTSTKENQTIHDPEGFAAIAKQAQSNKQQMLMKEVRP